MNEIGERCDEETIPIWIKRLENVAMRDDAIRAAQFLSPLPSRNSLPRKKQDLPASISGGPGTLFGRIDLMTFFLLTFNPMLRRAFTQAAKMSTYTTDKASPFTRAVISSMRKLYDQALSPVARVVG